MRRARRGSTIGAGSTDSFEAALIEAVNLADDADTVGAVTGQLAGALYGHSAIPDRRLRPLTWHERIGALADGLSCVREGATPAQPR
ncbi:ADP-ribosylglycohydrolase family protein [Methylobacterium radiodurans]|uniref:ADP-ribosylglycohydrolase family protein n=1 Tax=Methylobacterium radiodurans TaxID=2202828 RepID=UPI001FE3864B|nr:ADP-ribosylglycohydrolase family protein [Methylobacterium radiodurans]